MKRSKWSAAVAPWRGLAHEALAREEPTTTKNRRRVSPGPPFSCRTVFGDVFATVELASPETRDTLPNVELHAETPNRATAARAVQTRDARRARTRHAARASVTAA